MMVRLLLGAAAVLPMLVTPLYMAVLAILLIVWRRPARAARLQPIGAWLAVVAASLALVSNLAVALGPEISAGGVSPVGLVVLAVIFPGVSLMGAVLLLRRHRAGVPVLSIGIGLWLFSSLVSLLAEGSGFYG